MKVLVCVKRVPMTGGRIVLTEDEQAIETKHLGFAISPHEECGVEEAVRLWEHHGGDTVVLTLGPADAVEQLRDSMAIGIARGIHLVTDGEEWDPEATAAACTHPRVVVRGEAEGMKALQPVMVGVAPLSRAARDDRHLGGRRREGAGRQGGQERRGERRPPEGHAQGKGRG